MRIDILLVAAAAVGGFFIGTEVGRPSKFVEHTYSNGVKCYVIMAETPVVLSCQQTTANKL